MTWEQGKKMVAAIILDGNSQTRFDSWIMDKEILWKQYCLYVDLYKFYMDLTVKINLFYYGITGAILSFYFAHPSTPLIKYALTLPILMGLAFCGIFFYGASLMPILHHDLFDIRDKLGLATAPDLGILTIVLRAFAILLLFVAIGLSYLVFKGG